MIDELDLAFDEKADRTKPRHRRSRGGKGRTSAAFLLTFVLLAVLGGGVYLGYNKVRDFFTAADYDGPGTGTAQVQIKESATLTDMGNALVDADVVKSTAAFVNAADANPQGHNIRSGTYNLRKQMAAKDAVTLLLDPKSRVSTGVTIPEGKTAKQVYALLSKATNIPVKDFEEAAKDPVALGVPAFWFNRTDGQKPARSIEGFLFPDTYEFQPKGTAEQVLQTMVAHFLKVAEKIDFVNTVQKERKISPYEALTVASLAQAEAGNEADLGKVARVAYNRIYSGSFPCSCLQFDVGINYYYQLTGRPTKPSKDMTLAELTDPKNPYRTHNKPGLTPTPINNPGQAALEGAMKPPAGQWLYFVAIDKQGHSAFATTLDGQRKNEAIARKNGVL
ncbi:endolytic transglycosylase MltG [Krasilnikovia sp. MM14-A1004]|uniref:endolytic transglycosylase MltG n=1 Tax=Krasilnikovia sp. MM14-A1004 TaxID=3373541 RepID=UPI00399C8222